MVDTTPKIPVPPANLPLINPEHGGADQSYLEWFQSMSETMKGLAAQFPVSVENDISYTEGIIVLYPENRDYPILTNSPYAGTITGTLTKAFAGTGTATFKKNGTAIGGTANSISTSEDNQSHSVDFAIGDDLSVTVSSASTDLELAELRINLTRAFNWLQYAS